MAPIPLAPLKLQRKSSRSPDREEECDRSERRAGLVIRTIRYVYAPFGAWTGTRSIRGSAASIGETIRDVRVASRRDARFRLFPSGEFDLETTASLFSIPLAELERRLTARRRQTAWTSYLCFVLAIGSCLTWIGQVFGGFSEPASNLLIVNSMLFGGVCVLWAFYQALVNFQLRAKRAVGWKEFLVADRGFWPVP